MFKYIIFSYYINVRIISKAYLKLNKIEIPKKEKKNYNY